MKKAVPAPPANLLAPGFMAAMVIGGQAVEISIGGGGGHPGELHPCAALQAQGPLAHPMMVPFP